MADLVGGFLVPHDPLVTFGPAMLGDGPYALALDAYRRIAERLKVLAVDVAIIITSDHYVVFSPACHPACAVVTGEPIAPFERLPGMERRPLPIDRDLAQHLIEHGRAAGVDWAVARPAAVDHAIAIPHRLVAEPAHVLTVVPIYLASTVEPPLPARRAREIGEAIGQAVAAWPARTRIAVIASGGLSHHVGTTEMGSVNPEFDQWVLRCVEAGDIDALSAVSDADLVERAGNGALELRQLVCAMAAIPEARGDTVEYLPSTITGLGFAQLSPMPAGVATPGQRNLGISG